MQRSLAAAATLLALSSPAAALARHELAPTADHVLTPASDLASDVDLGPAADSSSAELELGEEPPSWERVTSQHSHSVLKELVAAEGKADIKKAEMLDSELDPASEAASAGAAAAVPAQQPQAEPRQQAPPGQTGLCAGPAIYDGPTMGWEDCRTRCIGHCRFWSFWHDSVQHRCKLTTDCFRRERDGHLHVSAYRISLDAASEEESKEQAAWDRGETPVDPELPEDEAAAPRAAPEAEEATCSPRGSARRFAISPESGWHNLGKARSYVSCANTSLHMGFRNLVWNVGSTAQGRCYGFSSDVPDVLERSCEEAYCWLFGAAVSACRDQGPTGGAAAEAEVGEKVLEERPPAAAKSTVAEAASPRPSGASEAPKPPRDEQKQGALQKLQNFFHRLR